MKLGGFIWELTQTVLLTLLIFFAVRAVVQNFKVEGTSMEPTLHNSQFLIINTATYTRVDGTPLAQVVARGEQPRGPIFVFGEPRRGDLIGFRHPPAATKRLHKR